MYAINCASSYFTTFALLPLLMAAKTVGKFPEPGNVAIISSLSGLTKTSQKGQFSYNSSKCAKLPLFPLQCFFAQNRRSFPPISVPRLTSWKSDNAPADPVELQRSS